VVAGATASTVSLDSLVAEVLDLVASGTRLKDAVAEIAVHHSVSKSALYQLCLDAKRQG